METKFQTSFIPKRGNGTDGAAYSYKKPLGVLFMIAVFVASVSVLAAIGSFVYKTVLTKSIEKKENELTEKYAALPRDDIDRFSRTADKLSSAQEILNNHVAVLPVFFVLQDATAQKLRFTELNYTQLAGNKMALVMKGEATNLDIIARQSEFFLAFAKKFNSPIFSNLGRSEKGTATFSLLTSLDPSLISYREAIKSYPSTYNETSQ
jgi:hypothetical protein